MTINYQTNAESAFSKMLGYFTPSNNIYADNNNYWRLGNSLDTMIEYLRSTWPSADDKAALKTAKANAAELMQRATERYDTLTKHSGYACWYDDYCWWGIASAKAYHSDYQEIFGAHAAKFQGIADSMWKVVCHGKGDGVHLGTANVWSNRNNQSKYKPQPGPPIPDFWATPRFNSGVGKGMQGAWQYDIFMNGRNDPPKGWTWTGPGECNAMTRPSVPNVSDLGPYQLSLMNGLYLQFALQLYTADIRGALTSAELQTRKSDAETAAGDVLGYFRAWFGKDETIQGNPATAVSKEDSLLVTFADGTYLLRERPTTYAKKSGAKSSDPYPKVGPQTIKLKWGEMARDPDTSWGGGQGLLVDSLIWYSQVFSDSGDAAWIKEVCGGVAKGVASHMSEQNPGGAKLGNVIRPYYPQADSDNWLAQVDSGDYACGNGTFLRYLLMAAQRGDNTLFELVHEDTDYRKFLQASADAFEPEFMDSLFDGLNGLAISTLAIYAGIQPPKPALTTA